MIPMRPGQTNKFQPNAGNDNQAILGPSAGTQVVFVNTGSALAFAKFTSSSADTANDSGTDPKSFPIPAGAILTYTRDVSDKRIVVYCAGATTVYATAGTGA